ncbi:putative lysophospholipase [Helianthus debilis subsp. tardiflorus]
MWWNRKGNTRQPLSGCMVSVTMARGFDVVGVSEDASQDVQGMDASAAYVLSLFSTEPPNSKLGVGGFSMGAATAIYPASCFVCGKFGNGTGCRTHLDAVFGLSGWLPCARALSNGVEDYEVEGRFSMVRSRPRNKPSAGFGNLTFKPFNTLGHYINPEVMAKVASWLTSKLELEGSPSSAP